MIAAGAFALPVMGEGGTAGEDRAAAVALARQQNLHLTLTNGSETVVDVSQDGVGPGD